MKLIVGLGNPGKEYELTRHNCGFRVVDAFADMSGIDIDRDDFHGLYGKFKLDDEDIILFKPMTMMNLSGTAVREIVNFYKIQIEDILVIFDDLAIAPGTLRLRLDGSSGGQKGMQNIIENFGTDKIKRIRVGIGEPEHDTISWVLGKPEGQDKTKIDDAIIRGAKAIREFLLKDFSIAMCKFNGGGNS